MTPYSIYIHIPFCLKRCYYCDFNTYAGLDSLIPEYVWALQQEIQILASKQDERLPVHTLFFGGGTPSLLPIGAVHEILGTLQKIFDFESAAEISLEANPGTLSPSSLSYLYAAGVNRLSLGIQSAQPRELRLLGRQHTYQDASQALKWARQAGFDNLNLDLIFGLPEQTLAHWQSTLTQALDLDPEHFSLYALTIEPGTPMFDWASRGLISTPDPDLAADMYDWACEALESAGYIQYEISNFAKHDAQFTIHNSSFTNPHFACLHNLQYWRNLPYLGIGAGAHGYDKGVRTSNVLTPESYIQRMSGIEATDELPFPHSLATLDALPIDLATEMAETMMMGLRLTREGVSDAQFQERFATSIKIVFAEEVYKLANWGLLEWIGDVLRLTPKGRLLGNQVFMEFV
jgi:oxygen-independent coproporphyrinogen-3 oxidase